MRLITVGTGAAAPSASRVQAGHLVETGPVRLLMDCGSGISYRLAQLGLDWLGITHLALTHFDADHVSDIPTLLVAWRYGTLPPRTAPLRIIGPPGVEGFVRRLAAALDVKFEQYGFPVEFDELEMDDGGNGPTSAPVVLSAAVTLSAVRVPHTDASVAYSIERGGHRIVYTGDTGPSERLGEWAAGCDLLLAECSLPAAMAIPTHMTPERCAELAALARPKRLALTHFYPPVERVDIPAVVASRYDGPVTLAYDGWQLQFEDD